MKKVPWIDQRLVLIEWVDSHYVSGWHTDEPREEPLTCWSVGWLLHDGDEAKTLASHMTKEEVSQRAGEITIPAVAIVRVQDI